MFARGTSLPVMKPLTRKAQSRDRIHICDMYLSIKLLLYQDTIMSSQRVEYHWEESYWQDL